MNTKKINVFIGSDHSGVFLKQYLIENLNSNYLMFDLGVGINVKKSDYPLIAQKVALKVAQNKNSFGIIICGSGNGVLISANKIDSIRCGYGANIFSAKLLRSHNNANMIALGARIIAKEYALEIVKAFLQTPFSNQKRHIERINLISNIEGLKK